MKHFFLIVKILIIGVFIFIIFNLGFYIYAYITPKTPLKTANQISFYDKNNHLVFANIDGSKWTSYENISKNVKNSTISVEDKNFFKHKGFDYLRIASAAFSNIKNRNINQGASTISQQYIKNLYLDFNKNWKRKIEEAYLTFELETHYSKKEILEGYLNTINYGSGNYGIENASLYYFGKNSKNLSLAEASLLVGIPKNPTKYNLTYNYENAKKRQKLVLKSMVNNGYISKKTMNKVYNEKVKIVSDKDNGEESNINYYKDAVLTELKSLKEVPESLIKTGGLKIYTNLDREAQSTLNKSIKNNMNNKNKLQVAALVAEPKTGKITALIGGKSYKKSEFNRVTQSKRQVGSTIKPFLYYSALENNLTASSTFKSAKTTFNVDNNKVYSPSNYNDKYANKNISMAAAIAYSDNIYAVKTHLFLGENELLDTLQTCGIKTNLEYSPSLALGTEEINMLDYANGYITLANYGQKNEQYLIRKVTDYNGKLIYQKKKTAEQVLNKNSVFILNELLSNTYNYNFIDYISPTMISVKSRLTKKYAVKSGSTDTDYWTIGYNPEALVMVWNGYDDNKNLNSSQSRISKNIWANTIEGVLKDKKNIWYNIPNDITPKAVNPISGEETNSGKKVTLYYLKGTEPIRKDEKIITDTFLKEKSSN